MVAAAQRCLEEAAAREAAIASQVGAVLDAAARRAHEEWMRQTKEQRTEAAELIERVLGPGTVDAPADAWYVLPDSTTVTRFDGEEFDFAVWPVSSYRSGVTLVLGVRRPGSAGRYREIATLADFGNWLNETAG